FVGADHRVKPPFLGLLRRARERRVDVERALWREIAADLGGRRRLGGRGIDDDEALARSAENAVLAIDDLLDLRRPGHAKDYDVRAFRQLRVGLRLAGTRCQDVLSRFAIPVHAYRQWKALGHEI